MRGMRTEALAAAAVVLLVIAPVLAFNGANGGNRATKGAVASDASAFLFVNNLAPTGSSPAEMTKQSNWEAQVLTVRHDYADGSRLALEGTLAPGSPSRFRVSNPTAVLTTGATHTFKVEDLEARHTKFCGPVVLQVRATVVDSAGARRGTILERETVHLLVGPRC